MLRLPLNNESVNIVHTADIHLKPSTFNQVEEVFSQLLNVRPNLLIISGDLLDGYCSVEFLDTVAGFLQRVADKVPIFHVRGTPSHDVEVALKLLSRVSVTYPYVVSFHPGSLFFHPSTSSFSETPKDSQAIQLLSLPQLTNVTRTEVLDIISRLRSQIAPNYLSFLVGHGMIENSILSFAHNDRVSLNDDDTIPLGALNFPLVLFGHIHVHQSFGDRIFYAGSPIFTDYGDISSKGFNLVSCSGDQFRVRRIPLQVRKKETLVVSDDFTVDKLLEEIKVKVKVNEVDLKVELPNKCDANLVKLLKDAGVDKVEKRPPESHIYRCKEILNMDFFGKVKMFAELVNFSVSPGLEKKVTQVSQTVLKDDSIG